MKGRKDAVDYYGYFINLDEPGGFFAAHVRGPNGQTIFEVRAGDRLEEEEGESSLFEDGYMRHTHDVHGLTQTLRDWGVIAHHAVILPMAEFEALVEREARARARSGVGLARGNRSGHGPVST